MSNKLIKDKKNKVEKKRESKFIKHILSTKGSTKGIHNWFFYLVILCAVYGVITNI